MNLDIEFFLKTNDMKNRQPLQLLPKLEGGLQDHELREVGENSIKVQRRLKSIVNTNVLLYFLF
jgi:hypothetical protein